MNIESNDDTLKIELNCSPEKLNEVLCNDYLNIGDQIYIKRERAISLASEYINRLEQEGKIVWLK